MPINEAKLERSNVRDVEGNAEPKRAPILVYRLGLPFRIASSGGPAVIIGGEGSTSNGA